MGFANYTNLSELMNKRLENGEQVSISELVKEAEARNLILASEGEKADRADLENGFIALVETLYQAKSIEPQPANEMEAHILQLFRTGKLAENGYGNKESDQFLDIKWITLTKNLPVIVNL